MNNPFLFPYRLDGRERCILGNVLCPSCKNGTLIRNREWDRSFDRLDNNYPSLEQVYKELEREDIPLYNCSNSKCSYKRFA